MGIWLYTLSTEMLKKKMIPRVCSTCDRASKSSLNCKIIGSCTMHVLCIKDYIIR